MVRPTKHTRCMSCQKPHPLDSNFCSNRCGRRWADGYLSAGAVHYCETCGTSYWEDTPPPICDYCGQPSGSPDLERAEGGWLYEAEVSK